MLKKEESMKPIKRLIAAAAAAVCMISCGIVCSAEGEDDKKETGENYVVTTTTGTSAEGRGGVVWTQLPPSDPAKELEQNAVNVGLTVSNIEDNKFTAALDISTKEKLTAFSGSVGYDATEYRLLSAELAVGEKGTLTDEKADGKYTFKYSCEGGSARSGQYLMLNFELIKEAKRDDVLFLSIDSMLAENGETVGFNKSDGIVSPSSSPNFAQNVKAIRLAQFAKPYTFEELGFENVINCEINGGDIAKFSDGGIVAMTPGTVDAKLIFSDYTIQKVRVEVYSSQDGKAADDTKKTEKKAKQAPKAKWSVNIGVPVLLCAALVFAEYLVIVKPRQRRAQAALKARAQRGNYDPRYQQHRRGPRDYR